MTNVISLFNPETVAQQADELFTIDNLPLYSEEYGKVENKRGLFVGDKCINVVSPSYEVHQPQEILRKFEEVAEYTGLLINRTLTNPANGGLIISAKYGDTRIVGDEHDINLTFCTSHCSKVSTFLTLDLLRMACFNQIPALYSDKKRHIFAEKHYKNALNIDLIQEALENIPAAVDNFNHKAELLMEKPFSVEDFVALAIDHYKMDPEAKRFNSKVELWKSAYFNAEGQRHLPDTAWKAYNAVTYQNTHGGRNTIFRNERVLTQGSADSLKFMDKLLAA